MAAVESPKIVQKPLIIKEKKLPPPLPRQVGKTRKGEYVVAAGDTIYGIARELDVPVGKLLKTNRLKPPFHLMPGQRLRIPRAQWHTVAAGDTLSAIAGRHGLTLTQIARANRLSPPYVIHAGQRLSLADGPAAPVRVAAKSDRKATPTKSSPTTVAPAQQRVAAVKPPKPPRKPSRQVAARVKAVPPPVVRQPNTPAAVSSPEIRGSSSSATPPPRSAHRFAWPLQGRIVSRFGVKRGGRYNDGINILANTGTAIRAAENGVVAYRGNELPGFGNLLLIRHQGGWMTAYAHTSEITVKPGQKVRRGQMVARVGRSGSVRRPQLHFEIRRGKRAVDPLRHLSSSTVQLSRL